MNKLLQRLKFDQVSNLEKLLQVCPVEFNLLGKLLTMKYRTNKEYEQGQDIYMFVYHVREESKTVYDVWGLSQINNMVYTKGKNHTE
jgi:hypothetical protein